MGNCCITLIWILTKLIISKLILKKSNEAFNGKLRLQNNALRGKHLTTKWFWHIQPKEDLCLSYNCNILWTVKL